MVLPFISDIKLFMSLLLTGVLVIMWLGIAAHRHNQRRNLVPIRIHVAGSRGKTSVTRLIGAALREAGIRTLVKTTGTDPLLILPSGEEKSWLRWAPPSISEQIRFFKVAKQENVQAIVLESMAIEPEYLWASEHYLVQATHTVITNARPDHAEVVGHDPMNTSHALSLVLPETGKLIIADEAAHGLLIARMYRSCNGHERTQIIPITGYHHEISNRGLARAVTRDLNIADEIAEAGFDHAGKDPGAFSLHRGDFQGKPVRFANAFSCNDALSLMQLWEENAGHEKQVVLFNLRSDRPERTRAFLAALAGLTPAVEQIFTTGFVPKRWVRAAGLSAASIERLPFSQPEKALLFLAEKAGHSGMIWGIGNYSDFGKSMIKLLREMEKRAC